jgi:hypothetical protein
LGRGHCCSSTDLRNPGNVCIIAQSRQHPCHIGNAAPVVGDAAQQLAARRSRGICQGHSVLQEVIGRLHDRFVMRLLARSLIWMVHALSRELQI